MLKKIEYLLFKKELLNSEQLTLLDYRILRYLLVGNTR